MTAPPRPPVAWQIVPDAALGGGAVAVARLIRALAGTPGAPAARALLPRDADAGVRALFEGLPQEIAACAGLAGPVALARDIARRLRPGDMVHAHGARAAAAALLARASRLRRVPVVHTVHGFHGLARPGPLGAGRGLQRLLARRVDATVLVSHADAAAARGARLRFRGPAEVIDNPVLAPAPAAATDPAARRDVDVVFVGRLVAQKNPLAFVRLAARLPEGARALLIGDGPLRAEVAAAAAAAALPPGRMELAGALPSATTLARLRGARLQVSTALWEGMPTAAVEAALSGALPVGLAIPPLAELLGPCAPRCLADDEDALAALVAARLADPAGREADARALQAMAADRFDPARAAARHAALYARLAAPRRRTRAAAAPG